MPDSEQKTRDAVLAPATPATITPSDNLTVAPSPASTSGLLPEVNWTGDVGVLFPPVTDPPAAEPSEIASDPEAFCPATYPPPECAPLLDLPLNHEVNQALARLEMNSLQVRLYLDSIEEKIGRMEPRLEQMSEGQQTPSASAPQTPASISPESTTDRRRRRLEIPPSAPLDRNLPVSPRDGLSDDDPRSIKPWLLARRKQLAITGAVLIAFVTLLLFGTGDHSAKPAPSSVPPGTPAPAPSSSSASIPKISAAIPFTPSANPQPPSETDPQLAASDRSAANAFPPDAASSPAAPANPDQPPAPGTPTAFNPSRATGSVRAAASIPSAIPESGRVRVSSGVMAGNLLFSTTPKYPGGFATLFHMEGKVTMQAVIARSGRVENLRVLSGHRLLRSAAQDAVRTWRYRPYLINGVPVEVATIVTVEFHR